MALKPLTYEDSLYQLLRDGQIKEFNQRKSQGEPCQLTSCDFRHFDLRGLDAIGIDFSNCYFRAAVCAAAISQTLASKTPASTERGSPAPFFLPS
jgi:uncharacterized protein YjbI with pentapeptide repeats